MANNRLHVDVSPGQLTKLGPSDFSNHGFFNIPCKIDWDSFIHVGILAADVGFGYISVTRFFQEALGVWLVIYCQKNRPQIFASLLLAVPLIDSLEDPHLNFGDPGCFYQYFLPDQDCGNFAKDTRLLQSQDGWQTDIIESVMGGNGLGPCGDPFNQQPNENVVQKCKSF